MQRHPLISSLFDLATDIGETHNVAADHPDMVAKMTAKLHEITGDQPVKTRPAKRKNKPAKP